MSNPMFTKPKDVRYVDMAIYVDEHFYDQDADIGKIFSYLYLLAYMLASKAKYFTNSDDYDGYAFYLAKSTYSRLINTNKVRVKSVLNYMKSIMYFRKVAYLRETFSEIIDPFYNEEWNGDLYREQQLNSITQENRYMLEQWVLDTLNTVPVYIKQCIPDIYKNDKLVYKNLYMSALFSFIDRVTLPKQNSKYFTSKQEGQNEFNTEAYYNRHVSKNSVILWHLPEDMEDVVRIILNKSMTKISHEITDTTNQFSFSEKSLDDMFREEILDGEDYEGIGQY